MRNYVPVMVDSYNVVMSRVPILVILGSTGSGKSRLGIELAQRFSGEIVSADSMQIYKGLDIVTAKVTKEERSIVPHHMLDVVDPTLNFTVVDFRNRALPIMDDLILRKKIPIIVGGTNYYIESLLWQVLVEEPWKCSDNFLVSDRDNSLVNLSRTGSESRGQSEESSSEKLEVRSVDCESGGEVSVATDEKRVVEKEDDDNEDEAVPSKRIKFEEPISNEDLHKKLQKVDPEMARSLHPNNRRKILRSLQVFEQHGKKHSEILKAQRLAGGSGLGGPLRHKQSIIFWLQCDQAILDIRLDDRVDSMLKAGLIQELLDFHEKYNQERVRQNESPDYTKGIFQTIGFKEFHEYLILPEEERNSEKGQLLFKKGVENLKMATKRYARRQQKWVKNRLIRRIDREVPPVYSLDCTNVDSWDERVLQPAVAIVSSRMKGETPEQKPVNEDVKEVKNTDSSTAETNYCEICEKILIGEVQWKAHLEGAKHWRTATRKKKAEANRSTAESASEAV